MVRHVVRWSLILQAAKPMCVHGAGPLLLRGRAVRWWISCQLQFVVGLGDKVAPTDIEEGMRVGCALFPDTVLLQLAAPGTHRFAPTSRQSNTAGTAPMCDVLFDVPSGWTARSTKYRSRCRPRSTPLSP